MSEITFYSINKLVSHGQSIVDDYDVVSFDMFDTLLVRRVHNPDLVKHAVARYISNLAKQFDINRHWTSIQTKRNQIEHDLRQETGKHSPDFEAHYPTFMAQTLQAIFKHNYDPVLLDRVTDYELKMESTMLVPRHEMVKWMGELHRMEKKILVISDIYLPATHLQILLEASGLMPNIDKVISSADTANAKASGAAYSMLTREYKLNPEKWMHIGDNPISDGLRAHNAGISSLVLQDWKEFWRRGIAARYFHLSLKHPYWKGRVLQQSMAPLEAENVSRSELFVEGYNFLGPIMGYYIQSIAEYCRKHQISKLYFCSREGWLFKQYWQKCTDILFPDQNLPEIEYLYVSRIALASASCGEGGLTLEKVRIAFLPEENNNFEDICRVYSLDLASFKALLLEYDLENSTVLRPENEACDAKDRENFNALLRNESFQEKIKQQTKSSHEALELYLSEVGLFEHNNVAIADIGWLGTIQRFLNEAISHRNDKPNLHGLLFAATRGIAYDWAIDNQVKGIIYDRHKFDLAASTIMYAKDVFEEACRAPHATLMSYDLIQHRDEPATYELNFREMNDLQGQNELQQDKLYADLQQGILDSAPRYAAASAILFDDASFIRPWLNYLLISKLAFAKHKEICALRFEHHLDDFKGEQPVQKNKSLEMFEHLWIDKGWKLRFLVLSKWPIFNLFRKKTINNL